MEQHIFRARRVPSATYCEQQNVIETIAGAKTQAAEIIATAQSDAEKLRADLEVELADTRSQSMAAAEEEVAEYMATEKAARMADALAELLAFSKQCEDDFNASSGWLTDVVVQSVQRVLSGLSEDDLDRELILSAIKECGARWKLELRVAQAQHAKIETLLKASGAQFDCIESVVAQGDLQPGQMLLLSASGITDISLEVQLKTLADVIRNACRDGAEKT